MNNVISYFDAKQLFDKYVQTKYLRLHMRESEEIMRHLAKYFGTDENLWGCTGLLHDLDLDIIGSDLSLHGTKTVEILQQHSFGNELLYNAILAHTPTTTVERTTQLDFALAASENVTGIISAYALMLPDKKVASVKTASIIKRLKEPRFAASVNRAYIYDIENTGIELIPFIDLAINAMNSISDEIGM